MKNQQDRHYLSPVGNPSSEEDSILTISCNEPSIRGLSAGGNDYYCGKCKQQIILESILEGQIWDLYFRCPTCGILVASQRSTAGWVCPKGSIFIPKGEFSFNGPLDIPSNIVIFGERAKNRYNLETGSDGRQVEFVQIGTPTRFKTFTNELAANLIQEVKKSVLGNHF